MQLAVLGVVAVITQLCLEPVVQGSDDVGVVAGERDASTVGQIGVVDGERFPGRLELPQARHVLAVNVSRGGKVASGPALDLGFQMGADVGDLRLVSGARATTSSTPPASVGVKMCAVASRSKPMMPCPRSATASCRSPTASLLRTHTAAPTSKTRTSPEMTRMRRSTCGMSCRGELMDDLDDRRAVLGRNCLEEPPEPLTPRGP